MQYVKKIFCFGKETKRKPIKEYHSMCRKKKNHITITIHAESEEWARKLMIDMIRRKARVHDKT